MIERRQINRVPFKVDSIIVDRETQTTYKGTVHNVSPLGIAIITDASAPDLTGKDVIIVAETIIMYANTVRREDRDDGTQLFAFQAKKFTPDVLQYLFDRISTSE